MPDTKTFRAVIPSFAYVDAHAAIAYLCEKFGFEKVAQFKEVGRKFEKWIDVEYWQLFL